MNLYMHLILKKNSRNNSFRGNSLLLTLFLVFVFVLPSCATDQRDRGSRPSFKYLDEIMYDLKQRISLTKDQKKRVRPIMAAFVKERGFIYNNAQKGDKAGLREKMNTLYKKTELRLAKVLSEEQLELYKQYQEEEKQKLMAKKKKQREGGTRRGSRGGGKGSGMGRRGMGGTWGGF